MLSNSDLVIREISAFESEAPASTLTREDVAGRAEVKEAKPIKATRSLAECMLIRVKFLLGCREICAGRLLSW